MFPPDAREEAFDQPKVAAGAYPDATERGADIKTCLLVHWPLNLAPTINPKPEAGSIRFDCHCRHDGARLVRLRRSENLKRRFSGSRLASLRLSDQVRPASSTALAVRCQWLGKLQVTMESGSSQWRPATRGTRKHRAHSSARPGRSPGPRLFRVTCPPISPAAESPSCP